MSLDKATGNILKTLVNLKSSGLSEGTVKLTSHRLKFISRNCDLDDVEAVKSFISRINGANSYKDTFVKAYSYYLNTHGLSWSKPKYRWERKIPKIPTQEQLTQVISASSKKYSTIFKILMETGVTPKELSNLSTKDIDTQRGILNFQGCKGHASRSFKLKSETHAMLMEYLRKFSSEHPFPDSYWMGRMWRQSRKATASKLQDNSLKKIRLYDLRHFYATTLYHRTKDILLVKQRLGHKKIETTLIYTQLVSFSENEEYCSSTAKTVEEAQKLIEEGFEYVTDMDGVKLFRKRK